MGPLFLFQFSASKKYKAIKDFNLEVNIIKRVCGDLFNRLCPSNLYRDSCTVTNFNSVIIFIFPRYLENEMVA